MPNDLVDVTLHRLECKMRGPSSTSASPVQANDESVLTFRPETRPIGSACIGDYMLRARRVRVSL